MNSLPMTRRRFGCCVGSLAFSFLLSADDEWDSMPWRGPARVRKVYVANPKPTWPCPDLDIPQEIADIESKLAELERKHPGKVRFVGGELLRVGDDAQAWVKGLGDVDAVLVLELTSSLGPLWQAIGEAGVPLLLLARPYSGWGYPQFAQWQQRGKRAEVVASSEIGDLDPYMRIFSTIHHLRRSKVLVITPSAGARQVAEGFSKQFGTTFGFLTYQDLQAAYQAADLRQAQEAAEEFTRAAVRVVEPSPKEVVDSLRFYLGVADLLRRERANAITIDCLGGFRRGELPAYPCVAWSKLNDRGMYGVCEADLPSTMTQMLVTSFSGRPGFVSDPVFDTSRNEVIHAHCVAATAMQGVGGASQPYLIRSHMEDNKGVSLQVLLPLGETVTVAKFADPTTFLVSTGEVAGNVDSRRGCRTQIRTRVRDARKMLEGYSGGLHRVIFYGDYVRPIEQMGRLMGFRVLREM